jgi:transposase
MNELYYIGLDVHKKSISYTIKQADGGIVEQGQVEACRAALSAWAGTIRKPWVGALEATLFTGWIYDHLRPFAEELQVAHPAMLKAIACGKKKNDRLDAGISAICCVATCCRAATWRRPRCGMSPDHPWPAVYQARCGIARYN